MLNKNEMRVCLIILSSFSIDDGDEQCLGIGINVLEKFSSIAITTILKEQIALPKLKFNSAEIIKDVGGLNEINFQCIFHLEYDEQKHRLV